MGLLKTLGMIGAGVAAPFTGGMSLAAMPVLSMLGNKPKTDPNATDPNNPLKDLTGYSNMLGTTGKSMLESGGKEVQSSRDMFAPITQRNDRLLRGDTNDIYSELAPEMDAIGQQFANVRNMIADQPRGGGKTSTLAHMPIDEIKLIANLVSQERSKAADTQTNVAGRLLSSGESERDTGLNSISAGSNVMLGKGNQDLVRRAQNIDLGGKIAETIAELTYLLKGRGGSGGSGGGGNSGGVGGINLPGSIFTGDVGGGGSSAFRLG